MKAAARERVEGLIVREMALVRAFSVLFAPTHLYKRRRNSQNCPRCPLAGRPKSETSCANNKESNDDGGKENKALCNDRSPSPSSAHAATVICPPAPCWRKRPASREDDAQKLKASPSSARRCPASSTDTPCRSISSLLSKATEQGGNSICADAELHLLRSTPLARPARTART